MTSLNTECPDVVIWRLLSGLTIVTSQMQINPEVGAHLELCSLETRECIKVKNNAVVTMIAHLKDYMSHLSLPFDKA
ncbi:MAG: hypothetical protein ACFFE1_17745, partial [Candidatus Thorarchaeota archaeon]